ncbi:MAG: SIS domain-containing protein [Bacillota bacterium]
MSQRAAQAKKLIESGTPEVCLFAGCGTSYYLSIAAAAFFQELTGMPSRAVPASELILRPDSYLVKGRKALLVAFSRSGETTETVVAAQFHRSRGSGPVIAVTCNDQDALGQEADLHIPIPGAGDRSVVMTSSFTSMLLAAELLAALTADRREGAEALSRLPGLLRSQLEHQRSFGESLGRDASHQKFIFLGMAPFFGLASEAMLKLKEMTQVPCEAYSPLEFRHGPISVAEPGTLAVLLGSDRGGRHELDVLRDVRSLGGRTMVVAGEVPDGAADLGYAVGSGLPDFVRGPLYMPLMQCLAYYRAMARGQDPDRPQHLNRVVTLDAATLGRE